MPSASGRINFYRILRQVRGYKNYRQLGVTTLGAFCVGTVTLSPPSILFNQKKEILDDHIIACPIQCYHEPIHNQLDKIKEEVRPRSLLESLIACIHSIGYAFHLGVPICSGCVLSVSSYSVLLDGTISFSSEVLEFGSGILFSVCRTFLYEIWPVGSNTSGYSTDGIVS